MDCQMVVTFEGLARCRLVYIAGLLSEPRRTVRFLQFGDIKLLSYCCVEPCSSLVYPIYYCPAMNAASCCFVLGYMTFLIIFLIGFVVVTISPTSALVLQAKQLKNANEQICQICGDTVGFSATGDVFVACNECAFPVCRPCYEYERKEGNQCCPQCKTRYKRHKGLFLLNLLICLTSSNCRINIFT